MWFIKSQHAENVKFKQEQRRERIANLEEYHKPITKYEHSILNQNVASIVKQVKSGELKPSEVLMAYGKRALVVHEKTNALTEIMIKDAEEWADTANKSGPLAGIPISLKDPFAVKGYDALAGYSCHSNHPVSEHSNVVRLLMDAGAYPYVKTNVPVTMMAIEGYNDIWGRTVNYHNPDYAPGGSSQGEGALISGGGSRLGIGSDIGGSVRVPAAWSGVCSLRMSTYRWPQDGDITAGDGFEGVVSVTSPLAKTLPDLKYFIESVFSMKPWNYDYELIPLPWRKVELPSKPKVGVLTFPDFLPPTPAQSRALNTAIEALKKRGCEVVEFPLPSPPLEYDNTISLLYYADSFENVASPLLKGEHNDPYVQSIMNYARIPRFIRVIWQSLLRLFGYKEYADIYASQRGSTSTEYIRTVGKREQLRRQFHECWDKSGIDFLICPPHPSPAIPNLVPESFRAILYTSLFNLLDFPAGVLPVGRVNSARDKLPASFDKSKLSYPAKITYDTYDAEKMEGLPIAVQVVAKRYQDEKALAAMEYVSESLTKFGVIYE